MYKHAEYYKSRDNMILDKYMMYMHTQLNNVYTLYLLEINKYSSLYCKQCKEIVLFLIREMSIWSDHNS